MSGLPDVGPWAALLGAILSLGLFTAHVADAREQFRVYHDDRAALEAIMALTLAVSSLGLVVAGTAPFLGGLAILPRGVVSDTGFAITGGALLVTSMTMFAIDRDLSRERR